MEEASRSWQKNLQKVLSDSQTTTTLANELEINPIVLRRWAAGETIPSPDWLRKLQEKLPDQTR